MSFFLGVERVLEKIIHACIGRKKLVLEFMERKLESFSASITGRKNPLFSNHAERILLRAEDFVEIKTGLWLKIYLFF